ncbi:MAG: hypothetical protein WBC71_09835, partial [Salaquimonas sp.]
MNFTEKTRKVDIQEDGPAWKTSVDASTVTIARKGYRWVGVTLGLFVVWAVVFPLSSAVVSSGKIISHGKNKLLQHPTGGVVRDISVEDGAILKKGQEILELEPTLAKADLGRLLARQSLLLAQRKRILDSEGGAITEIPIAELRGTQSPLVRKVSQNITASLSDVFTGQENEYNAKTARLDSEFSALGNQLSQQREELNGLEMQIAQQKQRVNILAMQKSRIEPLTENGYVAKAKLWETQSQLLDAKAQLSALEARRLSLAASMSETRDRIAQLKASESEDNAKEFSALVAELEGINQQIEAAT